MPEILDLDAATFDSDGSLLDRRGDRSSTHRRRPPSALLAGERAAQRWTWRATVERSAEVWAELARRPARSAEVRRPIERRPVALIGPMGGSPSGIGTYNEHLLPTSTSSPR
ncbi:MAG: hypothetical protein R2705_11625 [Ilumatobacteraceae bacterium]